MKKKRAMILLGSILLMLALLGCAKSEGTEAAFYAQGYLKDECVAEVNGARYAFLPKEGEQTRLYLYELDEKGGKKRIVCNRKDCLHEEQGILADPCHAYSVSTQGLMTDGRALYAQSKNGGVGIMRFDTQGGEPQNVLRREGCQITCFLVDSGMLYWAQRDQDGVYALYRDSVERAGEDAECLLSGDDRGYYAEIQEQDGTLYLTEARTDEDRMRLICVGADQKAETMLENVCAHTFLIRKNGFAAAKIDAEGKRWVVILNEEGQTTAEVPLGFKPCMMFGCGDILYADSGFGLMNHEPRVLYALNEKGEELGRAEVPERCGYLLGADRDGAYYWETGEQTSLVKIKIDGKHG